MINAMIAVLGSQDSQKLDISLLTAMKINLKQIKHLNSRPQDRISGDGRAKPFASKMVQ